MSDEMSKAGERLLDAADELVRFARGEEVGPMKLHVPDGAGGFQEHVVANIVEYRALWYREGLRAIGVMA